MHGLLIRKFTNLLTDFFIVGLIAKRDNQCCEPSLPFLISN